MVRQSFLGNTGNLGNIDRKLLVAAVFPKNIFPANASGDAHVYCFTYSYHNF